ncbi:MAG: ATP-binding protein [Alphaproteobacteria bacterium]
MFLVTEKHLRAIYGRPQDRRFVRVGHLASAESIPALVDIDRLVTRHSAVVGTTGSGKSTTVAGLLSALSDPSHYPAARILVIDIHGEYGAALADRARVFRINADKAKKDEALYIPYWALTADELIPVTFGQIDDAGRGSVLDRIADKKRESIGKKPRPGLTADSLTVDSPVPFSLHQLWFDLHCEMRATHHEQAGRPQSKETWALELGGDNKPIQPGDTMRVIAPRFRPAKDIKDDPEKIRLSRSPLNIGRSIDRLASRLRDPRFDFLFRPGPWLPKEDGAVENDLDSLLALWLGREKPITILDLSGVPPSIQSDLVAALLRIVYEALFWARRLPEGGRSRPLLVVLEEAHLYLSQPEWPAAQAVRRIAKEGRKYGIGAMIVSQRPSEVDHTILSQCGTLIAMRLTNSNDRGHVTSAATDNLEGLFAMLPILRTGEAVIVGEAVNLPVRTQIDRPSKNRRPDSADPTLVGTEDVVAAKKSGWISEAKKEDYARVMKAWREQYPRGEE